MAGRLAREPTTKSSGWNAAGPSRQTPRAVEITMRALRPYKSSNGDPRTFGAAVAGFGFVE